METAVTHYPVIVVGGGTMGTAAAWALGHRAVPALVLEQFGHVHTMGAHSGQTRIIRHAYAEGPSYVPLVRRADALWLELEAETGTQVLHRTGGLDLAAPGFGHARAARRSAEAWDLPFEWLDPAEVRHRWPPLFLPDDWEAVYSPQAGFLRVEPALRSLATAARARGVVIREQEPVLRWRPDGDGVRVDTARATYTADHLIVTAGAWSGHILADLGLPLTVLRKLLFWFAVDDPAPFAPDRFPVFIGESPEGSLYGFPLHDEPGLKVANHAGGDPTDPERVDRTVHPGEEADVAAFATRMLRGVSGRVVQSAACLYTMTPDTDFVVDRHPRHAQVVFGAGFSGHGFKFATAVGEHLVALALDRAARPLDLLALARLRGGAALSPA